MIMKSIVQDFQPIENDVTRQKVFGLASTSLPLEIQKDSWHAHTQMPLYLLQYLLVARLCRLLSKLASIFADQETEALGTRSLRSAWLVPATETVKPS